MLEKLLERTHAAIRVYKEELKGKNEELSKKRQDSISRILEIGKMNKRQNSAPDTYIMELKTYVEGMNGWLRKKLRFLDGSDLRGHIESYVFDFYEREIKKNEKSSKETVAMIEELRNQFKDHKNDYTKLVNENKELRQDFETMNGKIKSYEDQIKELKELLDSYLKTINELGKQVETYKTQTVLLEDKINEQEQELAEQAQAINKFLQFFRENKINLPDDISRSLPKSFSYSENRPSFTIAEIDDSYRASSVSNNGYTFFAKGVLTDVMVVNKSAPLPIQRNCLSLQA